ncbi:hypothetical protein AALO_G00046410 [Alosa alosa]|uniref:SPRY-associated domain-containing protein n=1 Tax=Alosa alosa TaxID=278164 RepID=A0AAV6H9I5_9TELE|nr:hypothetical protein AALO_G00046410 [Alosa alosa]
MGADDITLLQTYKSTVERAQCTLQDPKRVSGALINVAKHLGNLKFRVWEKYTVLSPVTLDPNTAHALLTLSEDLASVSVREQRQQLPENPERFDSCLCVLGSEGFNSGTHRWDVEPETVLTVKRKPLRVRVQLDAARGQLSFSDLDNDTHLHTFMDTFTERVFPCFITHLSFRILPVKAAESSTGGAQTHPTDLHLSAQV